jgi:hypothetical protein
VVKERSGRTSSTPACSRSRARTEFPGVLQRRHLPQPGSARGRNHGLTDVRAGCTWRRPPVYCPARRQPPRSSCTTANSRITYPGHVGHQSRSNDQELVRRPVFVKRRRTVREPRTSIVQGWLSVGSRLGDRRRALPRRRERPRHLREPTLRATFRCRRRPHVYGGTMSTALRPTSQGRGQQARLQQPQTTTAFRMTPVIRGTASLTCRRSRHGDRLATAISSQARQKSRSPGGGTELNSGGSLMGTSWQRLASSTGG